MTANNAGPVLTPEEAAALQKRCEKAERERDALRRDASQQVATDEMVRRLQHLGDWQAADRIEALQKRVAELETALQFIKDAPDEEREPNFDNMGSYEAGLRYSAAFARAALTGGKDE